MTYRMTAVGKQFQMFVPHRLQLSALLISASVVFVSRVVVADSSTLTEICASHTRLG